MPKKIIISSGINNYHMLFTASELNKRKRLFSLICGSYPLTKYDFIIYKFKFLKIINSLINRRHKIKENLIYDLWLAELISVAGNFLQRVFLINIFKEKLAYISFKLFQYQSLNFLKYKKLDNIGIFHFRSGFGGDTISFFKKRNIKTLCDHGIVHPLFLKHLILNKGVFRQKPSQNLTGIYKLVHNDLINSDYILVNSEFVKKTFIKLKIPSNKIFVIYQGLENNFLKLIPSKKKEKNNITKVLYSGNLSERKGILDIQKSLNYLKNCKIELHLAGNIEHQMQNKIKNLINNNNTVYHGNLDKKSLANLMYKSDIFLFPSYAEGSARVIFEAMACGCAIITTENSGSIVKNNINGLIIKPGKPKQIAIAIKYLLKNKKKLQKISSKNIKLIKQKFNQKVYGDKLVKIYKKIYV